MIYELEPNELVCYSVLRSTITDDDRVCYISLGLIETWATGTVQGLGRATRKALTEGLESLCQRLGLKRESVSKTEWLIDCSRLWFDTKKEHFVILDKQDIQKVFAIDCKNKLSLFNYFVVWSGTLNNTTTATERKRAGQSAVGFMPISYTAKLAKISESTAMRYNELMEQAQIIYIHRSTNYIATDDGIRSLSNHYGLYRNKVKIIAIADAAADKQEHLSFKKGSANHRRSMTQKLNNLKRGYCYSEEETAEILEYQRKRELEAQQKSKDSASPNSELSGSPNPDQSASPQTELGDSKYNDIPDNVDDLFERLESNPDSTESEQAQSDDIVIDEGIPFDDAPKQQSVDKSANDALKSIFGGFYDGIHSKPNYSTSPEPKRVVKPYVKPKRKCLDDLEASFGGSEVAEPDDNKDPLEGVKDMYEAAFESSGMTREEFDEFFQKNGGL